MSRPVIGPFLPERQSDALAPVYQPGAANNGLYGGAANGYTNRNNNNNSQSSTNANSRQNGTGTSGGAQPQLGKVISIERNSTFGTIKTTMKVQMNSGEERTITADGEGTRIASDIAEGDRVRLTAMGPAGIEWTKVVAVDDKKKGRKKRKVFDADMLLSEKGIPTIIEKFHTIKFPGKGHESTALHSLVGLYREWCFNLWPNLSFPLMVDKIELFGSLKRVKNVLTDLRLGREAHFDTADGRPVFANLGQQDESKENNKQLQVDRQTGKLVASGASSVTSSSSTNAVTADKAANATTTENKQLSDEHDDETRLVGFSNFEEDDLEQMRRRYEDDEDDEFERLLNPSVAPSTTPSTSNPVNTSGTSSIPSSASATTEASSSSNETQVDVVVSTQDLASQSQVQVSQHIAPSASQAEAASSSFAPNLLVASEDTSFHTSSEGASEQNIEMSHPSSDQLSDVLNMHTSSSHETHQEPSADQDEDDLLLQSHLALSNNNPEEDMHTHEDFSASSSFEPFVLGSEPQDEPQVTDHVSAHDWSSTGILLQVEGVRGQDSPSREGLSQ